ncbi:hypothetical protein KRMM14A1004_37180 [Krasilnikovia sp. MM14-A1004]
MTDAGFRVVPVTDPDVYLRATGPLAETVFPHELAPSAIPLAQQPENTRRLRGIFEHIHRERFLILDAQDEVQGCFSGQMEDPQTFNIGRVGLTPAFRKRGAVRLYVQFIEYIRELGYERLTSCHHPHNTEPLIVQMKLGFFVEGMVIDERLGPRVKMVLHLTEQRRNDAVRRFRLTP